MLYVSFTEILGKAHTSMAAAWGPSAGAWGATLAFFAGIAFISLVDGLIPSADNPHEVRGPQELSQLNPARTPRAAETPPHAPLMRTGLFAALAIGIHNFPEGLATFLAALDDPKVGIALAVAVALHNIPEGISVSVPIYFATGSRRRAFFYSVLSGLAEPVGALVGYVLLRTFFTDDVMGLIFGAIAGVMVYISLDELLPAARAYGSAHDALFGIVAGMAVMAVSLLLLR
jgi:ZIP family zinc transporter